MDAGHQAFLQFGQTHVHWVRVLSNLWFILLPRSSPALNLSQHWSSLPTNWCFTSGDQSVGASASASVLPMNIQDWLPLGLTCDYEALYLLFYYYYLDFLMWTIFKVVIEFVTILFLFYIYLFSGCEALGILDPWPGIEPVPAALEPQSLNHWTTS